MTKDKIDELLTLIEAIVSDDPEIAEDMEKVTQALQSQQVDLEKAKEILKDLGKISVPVELYRLSGVAKRAENLIKKMEKGDE